MSDLSIPEIDKYPSKISKPYLEVEGSSDPRAVHKSLLDLGEGLLDYLVAFMFGEYKQSGKIDESLEAEFYKNTGRNISAGVKAGFLRRLVKSPENSIIAEKVHAGSAFEKAGQCAQTFDLLKKIIGEGADSGFAEQLETLRKGRTVKKLGLNDFYNTFIQIRNTFAHPENKVNPKTSPRDWPLNEEYFAAINHELHQALVEIIVDFEIIKSFIPVYVNVIDSTQKNATVAIQRSGKPSNPTINLSQDDLEWIMSEEHYILDEKNALYAKLYLTKIPPLNPDIAEKIIRQEKSKLEKPRLEESINHMLEDGVIDHLEYFALKDSATRAFIPEESLKQMIVDVAKKKKGIDKPIDEILVENSETESRPMLNPWWLKYFSMLNIIDGKKVKEQRDELKRYKDKLKKLKGEMKDLPIQKKIERLDGELAQKEKQLKKCKEEDKVVQLNTEIDELKATLKEMESTKSEKCGDINTKISKIELQEKIIQDTQQWNTHKNLWSEVTDYFQYLADEHLNSNLSIGEDEEKTEGKWIIKPNTWQIGNLAHYYWGGLFKSNSILGPGCQIGVFVEKESRVIERSMVTSDKGNLDYKFKVPHLHVQLCNDDKYIDTIDWDKKLRKKYIELASDLRDKNVEEFKKLGANFFDVNGVHSMEEYDLLKEGLKTGGEALDDSENKLVGGFVGGAIGSDLWTLNDFVENGESDDGRDINEGQISIKKIHENEGKIVAYLKVFSNVINDINEYALQIGINEERIKQDEDKAKRLQKLFIQEAEKYVIDGKVSPEGKQHLERLAKEHGVGSSLFTMIMHRVNALW